MSVNLARLSLYLVGVIFLGLGVMSLIAPTNLTRLVEIAMPTSIAIMEVRGVYVRILLWRWFLLSFVRSP